MKHLHFPVAEFEQRINKAKTAIAHAGLDGVLMFKQESMYYLTGYDSMGYITFQCMYLGADGRIALLTRLPDLRQARYTSLVEDIQVLPDVQGTHPGHELRKMTERLAGKGARLGVEYEAYGLNYARARLVHEAFEGAATLVDASDLINIVRRVKSPAELQFFRKAGELADGALQIANEMVRPGVCENDVFAEMQSSIFKGGGFYPSSRSIMGSGPRALMVRSFTGHDYLIQEQDHFQMEFGAAYRHYHTCLMRTIVVGKPHERQIAMHRASVDALLACQEACRPGRTVGDIFEAHARTLDAAGFQNERLAACGYSLGAVYPPTWQDGMMIQRGNPAVIEPGMVFFMHMILLDSERGMTICSGETIAVTDNGCERLTKSSLDLVVN